MQRLSDIERAIEQMHVTTTAVVDERILSDAFAALEESLRAEWARARLRVLQPILKSKIMNIAVAAVIILTVLIGAELFVPSGPPTPPPINVLAVERQRIEQMAETDDVDGLVTMLSEGQYESKVLAARYLGDIGDETALPELQRLYLAAQENLPEGQKNPFAEPIDKIESRMEPEPGETVTIPDANDTTIVGVTEEILPDTHESLPTEQDVVVAVDVRAETPTAVDSNLIPDKTAEVATITEPNEIAVVGVTEGAPTETNIPAETNVPVETNETEVAEVNEPAETPTTTVFHVVHQTTKEPLPGVHIDIKIQRDGPDDVNDLVTNEQGVCKIDFGDLRTDYIMIKVHKEHFVPADIRVSKAEDETHISVPSSYTLALEPGTSIGGFVRNLRREPIEAATVFLRASGGATSPRFWIWDYEEKTDANGFWQCDIMPADIRDIGIRLAHPDYIDDESYDARSTPPLQQLRDMNSVMVMNIGVNFAGTVVDADGRPIAGASVRQGCENTWGIIYPRTQTDDKGKFEFPGTRAGKVTLTVQAAGYAPQVREVSVYYAMPSVKFQLDPAQTIRGRVVDAQDKPIEGVEVSLDSWLDRYIKWQTKTDAEGYFQWNEAPKDEMKFAFFKEGYRAIRFLEMTPDVDEHIIIMDAAMKVSGKVVDADSNEPISEFKLILGDRPIQRPDSLIGWDRESARTFTGGRYELEFDGRDLYFSRNSCYFIRVEADGHVPGVSHSFTQEQENVVVDFKLVKGKGPSGVVYLPDGAPATGARVALSTPSHPVFISGGRLEDDKRWQSVTTGPDGRFSFPPQIEKYLVVAVHNKGYAEAMEEELAAEPNIVIQPWGRVEGVLCVGGRALAGESVGLEYLRDYEQRVPRAGFSYSVPWTDANGHLTVERMVPGKVKIYHLFKMAGIICARTRSEIIDVSPSRTTYVTIGGSGRAVTGKFVAIGYEPSWHRGQVSLDLKLPEPARPNDYNEMIFVERREWDDNWRRQTEEGRLYERMERTQRGRSYRAKIERDGTFRVDDVPPGEYELRACLGSKIGGKVIWGPRKAVPAPDHVFVVPDVNETDSNQPLDLGVIKVRHEEYPGGDPAPVFEAVTFDGERTNLLAFRRKVVLLTFWRSEPSILSELDYAMQLAGNYKTDERFVALGISLDRDVEAAKKFAKDNGFEWINCFPAPGTRAEVADDYEIWKFPMTFVIDPYGYILTVDPTPLRFKSKVEKYLGNP